MENNQVSTKRTGTENSIDVVFLIRSVLKNWWVVLLIACIISMWTYMGISIVKTQNYSSTATLILSSKSKNSIYTDTVVEKAANQFQRIFTSDALKNIVAEEMDRESLPGTLTATIEEGSNLIMVTGTSSDPVDAYRMVATAIDNYMLVSDYIITGFLLEPLKLPEVPMVSGDALLAKNMAVKVGLIGFLGSAVLIAFAFFMKDDVKNERQAKATLDIPLFATVYFEQKNRSRKNSKSIKGKSKKSILITDSNTSFFYKETMNKLATKLEYQAKKEGGKVILVTSVSENEGKSTIASNLALALAKKQNDVLIFDTDLRRPALYKIFEEKVTKEQDIEQYLIPVKSVDGEKVKPWKKEDMVREPKTGLYYLFGKKKYSKSDMLIRSKEMDQLLQEARKSMDYIILDSPPGMVASDVELLAEKSDFVLLVVRQGVSCVGEINDMVDNLSVNNQKVLGCIFNAVQSKIVPWSGIYGYYGGYGYYRGYDSYGKYGSYGRYDTYGSEKRKKKAGETNHADL